MYIMYYTLFLTLTVLRSSEDKGFDEFLFPENVNDLGQEIAMAAQRICPGCLCLEGAVASSTVRLHPEVKNYGHCVGSACCQHHVKSHD